LLTKQRPFLVIRLRVPEEHTVAAALGRSTTCDSIRAGHSATLVVTNAVSTAGPTPITPSSMHSVVGFDKELEHYIGTSSSGGHSQPDVEAIIESGLAPERTV